MNDKWLWRGLAGAIYAVAFYAALTLLEKYGGLDGDDRDP